MLINDGSAQWTARKDRILASRDWLTTREIAKLGNFEISQLEDWKRERRIFSVVHNGGEYSPLYGFQSEPLRPNPNMKKVLDALAELEPWYVALWFDSVNSYLDGRRPKELLASEPGKVEAAALEEVNWEANG